MKENSGDSYTWSLSDVYVKRVLIDSTPTILTECIPVAAKDDVYPVQVLCRRFLGRQGWCLNIIALIDILPSDRANPNHGAWNFYR